MRKGRLGEVRSALPLAVCLALATAMLSAAALYNRFPLVDYDTSSHISSAASGSIYWLRSPIYSYFVLLLDGGGWTLWPVVIAQGLIGAYLIHLVMRVVLRRTAPGWYLACAVVIAAATSLPWVVGQIMPDVFAGYVILATFLLGYGVAEMTRTEVSIVLAIDTLSIAAHFTHVPLAAALAIAVVLLLIAINRPKKEWLLALARLGLPTVVVVVTLVVLQGATTGQWGFATAPRVLTLARWVADGPASAYLREACPTRHFAICDHLDELSPDTVRFVFGPQSIVQRLGGPLAAAPEAEAVLLGTAMRFPRWVVHDVAVQGWTQLWRFETGSSLLPLDAANEKGYAARAIRKYVASDYPAFVAARQVADELHLAPIRTLHHYVAWSGLVLIVPFLLIFVRRRDMAMVCLLLVVVVGLAVNAVICGANSMPVDRFQSRLIWLAVFVALCGIARLASRKSEIQAS
jgi:hypothetical protein